MGTLVRMVLHVLLDAEVETDERRKNATTWLQTKDVMPASVRAFSFFDFAFFPILFEHSLLHSF